MVLLLTTYMDCNRATKAWKALAVISFAHLLVSQMRLQSIELVARS